MAKMKWDQIGERLFETGTDRGVLFPQLPTGEYGPGVPWSGLTKVTESPEGGEETPLYADNIKYLSLYSIENLKGTIEAFTYPDEFAECDGSKEVTAGVRFNQQQRKSFAFAYRTKIGNDVDGTNHGYKLHIIYGVRVSPSERANETINETPAAMPLSWAFSSTPVEVEGITGVEVTAVVEVNSLSAPAGKMAALEELLYGGDSEESKLPTPTEVYTLMKGA